MNDLSEGFEPTGTFDILEHFEPTGTFDILEHFDILKHFEDPAACVAASDQLAQ
jgi:hypothetical protein